MAFNPSSDAWLGAGGATEDTGNLILAEAAFGADAADAVGDIRVLAYGLMEMLADAWDAVAVDATDLPTKMTIQRYESINAGGTEITHSYSVNIITSIISQDVADEV